MPLEKKQILIYPFFIGMIPLFFVVHGCLYYYGFIRPPEAASLALSYCLSAFVVYLLLWLLYRRNTGKAAVLTAFLLIIYFFFGAYHDFLLRHIPVTGRYSVLLPLLVFTLLIVIWRIKKAQSLKRTIIFLNLVFLAYLLIDGAMLLGNYIHPPASKFTVAGKTVYKPTANIEKPDIYFLIFDEYASSLSLRESYGYKNDLNLYLEQKGFHIQERSFSNYNYTPASIASILNMSFISGIKDSTVLTAKDMNYCIELIKSNEVMKFFSWQGYQIINCSDFNVLNNPVAVSEQLLPIKTRLITDNTLWSKINKDIFWNFYTGSFSVNWLIVRRTYEVDQNNRQLLQMIKEQSRKKNTHPVFVFGHLYMPHQPFYYDKNNRLRDRQSIITDELHNPAAAYLGYLSHVNLEIRELIDTIQHNTNHKSVIILMGDHGYRGKHIGEDLHQNYQNLNAVYLPGKNYNLFYDSISGVNQFKTVLNTLFDQTIPLLKDSTIFLTGKE
ncbi:MAG: sulfatase-like hydrolase/transferase [Chitinophagaceae bacterium]